MSNEKDKAETPMSLQEQYEVLKDFFTFLELYKLAGDSMWDWSERTRISNVSQGLSKVLPPSVKTISFPNGESITLGATTDRIRISEWDLDGVKKYTDNLGNFIGKPPLHFRKRRI